MVSILVYLQISVDFLRNSMLSIRDIKPEGVSWTLLLPGEGVASQNPYAIYNQICDFPYPIYDLTKILIPFLWPEPLIKALGLFQTCVISFLVQTNVKLPY